MTRISWSRWLASVGLVAAAGVALAQAPAWKPSKAPAKAAPATVWQQAPWHAARQPAKPPAEPTPPPVPVAPVAAPVATPAAATVPPSVTQTVPPKPAGPVATQVTWKKAADVIPLPDGPAQPQPQPALTQGPPPATPAPAGNVVPASAERPTEKMPLPVVVREVTAPAHVIRPGPDILPRMPHGYQDPTHPVGPGQPPSALPPKVAVIRTGK